MAPCAWWRGLEFKRNYPSCRGDRTEWGNSAHGPACDALHAFQESQPWGIGKWVRGLDRHHVKNAEGAAQKGKSQPMQQVYEVSAQRAEGAGVQTLPIVGGKASILTILVRRACLSSSAARKDRQAVAEAFGRHPQSFCP